MRESEKAEAHSCRNCINGCVPVTGNGGDGYEPCPDCIGPSDDDSWMHSYFLEAVWGQA